MFVTGCRGGDVVARVTLREMIVLAPELVFHWCVAWTCPAAKTSHSRPRWLGRGETCKTRLRWKVTA